jgi:Kef-type K+ transport system membrane component KefB
MSRHDARPFSPRWWWEAHQLVTSAVYVLMLYPAWRSRVWLSKPWDLWFFFVVVISVTAAVTVRLHLVFTGRSYPSELRAQRARAHLWIPWSDAAFAAALLGAALETGGFHPEVATLLVVVAVASLLAAFVIEPATTRAAFGELNTPPPPAA